MSCTSQGLFYINLLIFCLSKSLAKTKYPPLLNALNFTITLVYVLAINHRVQIISALHRLLVQRATHLHNKRLSTDVGSIPSHIMFAVGTRQSGAHGDQLALFILIQLYVLYN